ncbi:MAG TPA: hypothetical protein P5550_01185 [Bacteroidales bacterium]|nr:hypothetical protein [Bacteroidales bacterium]
MSETLQETGCCPRFDPAPWTDQLLEWDSKPFVKARVSTLFYMPLNFGREITRLMKETEANQAASPDYICLSDHTSRWSMDIYLGVNKPVPSLSNTVLSGKFFSRVYEGPFRDTGKWMKDFQEECGRRGHTLKKAYMWYTTCPKCAKAYGKNYVVVIGSLA